MVKDRPRLNIYPTNTIILKSFGWWQAYEVTHDLKSAARATEEYQAKFCWRRLRMSSLSYSVYYVKMMIRVGKVCIRVDIENLVFGLKTHFVIFKGSKSYIFSSKYTLYDGPKKHIGPY